MDRRMVLAAMGGAALVPPRALAGPTDQAGWMNPPRVWREQDGVLMMRAEPKTDFWRKTYFGYVTDNGHFRSQRVTGDFVATVNVVGDYAAQYDQAGLMVRLDHETWLKCGVERVDGVATVSAVFTRDFSDWSGFPIDASPNDLWFRLARKGSTFTYSWSADGRTWREVRQGHLTDATTLDVGVMAAAPEGSGFDVRFRALTIQPPAVQAGA
ncbi:DUF1349 domain-containing protein [Sphingomonas sp. CJ99]